jgi:hypothetical protein
MAAQLAASQEELSSVSKFQYPIFTSLIFRSRLKIVSFQLDMKYIVCAELAGIAVNLQTLIQEVNGLNLGHDIGYPA